MKHKVLLATAFAAGLALATAGTQSVSAAENPTSNAKFNVTGSNGTLTLDKVPGFDFGDQDLSELISTGLKTKNTTAADSDTLQVTDLTGASAGWTVSANMGTFANGANVLTAGTLTLGGGTIANQNATAATDTSFLGGTLTAGATGNTDIATATTGHGQGTTSASDISGELNIDPQAAAIAGQYSATITWTIAAGSTVSSTDDQAG